MRKRIFESNMEKEELITINEIYTESSFTTRQASITNAPKVFTITNTYVSNSKGELVAFRSEVK